MIALRREAQWFLVLSLATDMPSIRGFVQSSCFESLLGYFLQNTQRYVYDPTCERSCSKGDRYNTQTPSISIPFPPAAGFVVKFRRDSRVPASIFFNVFRAVAFFLKIF